MTNLLYATGIIAALYTVYKIAVFLIVFANADNLPGFNLYKAWFKGDKK